VGKQIIIMASTALLLGATSVWGGCPDQGCGSGDHTPQQRVQEEIAVSPTSKFKTRSIKQQQEQTPNVPSGANRVTVPPTLESAAQQYRLQQSKVALQQVFTALAIGTGRMTIRKLLGEPSYSPTCYQDYYLSDTDHPDGGTFGMVLTYQDEACDQPVESNKLQCNGESKESCKDAGGKATHGIVFMFLDYIRE
jgi:hypothetical protein